MSIEVAETVRQLGWDLRQSSNDNWEADCPFCGKKRKLYIHKYSGLWQCFRCQEKGNIHQLKARMGLQEVISKPFEPEKKKGPLSKENIELWHGRLLRNEAAMKWLTEERGLTQKTIEKFQLGVRKKLEHDYLVIPWLYKDNAWGAKYRILPGQDESKSQRFMREAGYKSILFNGESIVAAKTVLICGAEIDCMSANQMGVHAVCSVTTGESGRLTDEQAKVFSSKDKVYICFDNDRAGADGAKALARRIGYERAWIVKVPDGKKDINELLQAHGDGARELFQTAVRNAYQADFPTIVSVSQAIRDYFERQQLEGEPTEEILPWDTLKKRVKLTGLVALSGIQGSGKTTFGLQLANHFAWNNKPALFYCLEMTRTELLRKILCMQYETMENEASAFRTRAEFDYEGLPLWIGSSMSSMQKPKDIAELLRQATVRFALKLIVFDNLHVISRGRYTNEIIGELSRDFKLISNDLEVCIVAVAQPRKMEDDRIMSLYDISGSKDLVSDADQVLVLHRQDLSERKDTRQMEQKDELEQNLSPLTLVRVEKARFGKQSDSWLYLVGGEHRFRELTQGERTEVRQTRGRRDVKRWY